MVSSTEEEFRSSLLEWSTQNLREFPWREPRCSLYEVFVAEFFLTQTPAENVSSVYPSFLERFPSLGAIREANKDELVDVIEPLGFYNMRSEALQSIAAEHDMIPETVDELTELQRVGSYVANATLCFARGEPLPVLDRNVKRVYSRVFGDEWPESSKEQLKFAERLVPEDEPRTYNLALLDFGASICRPEPRCEECFATNYCSYYREK
jgi:A/G-specific adenine glycosylase